MCLQLGSVAAGSPWHCHAVLRAAVMHSGKPTSSEPRCIRTCAPALAACTCRLPGHRLPRRPVSAAPLPRCLLLGCSAAPSCCTPASAAPRFKLSDICCLSMLRLLPSPPLHVPPRMPLRPLLPHRLHHPHCHPASPLHPKLQRCPSPSLPAHVAPALPCCAPLPAYCRSRSMRSVGCG